jgi:putative acyl-CoA dehydrogenase
MPDQSSYVRTTHEVENQPSPLPALNAYEIDLALREGSAREAGAWLGEKLAAYGAHVYDPVLREQAALANRYEPELVSHDRYGHRIDEVRFHPAYHALMSLALEHGLHALTWAGSRAQPPASTSCSRAEPLASTGRAGGGGHVAHAALMYLHSQLEASTCCPLTMTHAAIPALRVQPELAAEWEPRVLGTVYDPRCIPASQKTSATLGMAMTEKQGGSDVRANTSRARPLGRPGPGEAYLLRGHKWFCSAPMSDAFLSLAQTDRGLSCFLVPRFLPDGTRNRFLIQRLKDKLGNRANASSEIEYDETYARLIGEEGRGVATILQMVAETRLDCAAGSAGLMRAALVEAIHHARERKAFGKRLSDQPLMRSVLADLALEAEAALVLTLRLARSYDESAHEEQRLFARVVTPLAKYWVTRRAPAFVFEAMECLGGAGYVEESALPRLYREAPVNSIWEGSGNIQCLDVLRALAREPGARELVFTEIEQARDPRLAVRVAGLRHALADHASLEARARAIAEGLSLCLCASLLLRHAPQPVGDAFCAARLGPDAGLVFGSLRADLDATALIERALPSP